MFLFEIIWRWNWMRKCPISLHSTTITLIHIIVKFRLLCENLGKKQIGHELEEEIKQLIYCWKKIGVSSLLLSSLGILFKNKCKPKIIKISLKYYKKRHFIKWKKNWVIVFTCFFIQNISGECSPTSVLCAVKSHVVDLGL